MAEAGKPKSTVKEGFLCGNPAAAPFKDIDDFSARGQLVHMEEFSVYEPEELITKILVPTRNPDYARASVGEAVAALMSTPDPDFLVKLILVDHVHSMAPWVKQTQGALIMSESADDGSVVLYRPDAATIQQSIMYEWCNLLRLYNPEKGELFSLSQDLESYIDLSTGKKVDDPGLAWNLLGSLLLRESDEVVFSLCVRFPLKAAIFGRTLVNSLSSLADFRQTEKYQHFLDRGKTIDFSASKVGLDALKKIRDANESVAKLVEFLMQQEVLKSIRP